MRGIEALAVNPVSNSSGALNPAGITKIKPTAEQRGIISNGVNPAHKKIALSRAKIIYIGINLAH
jgi:hypothetical protein